MRLSLSKRALVALALSLSFIAGAAAPAQATWMSSDSENRSNLNLGRADLHYIADYPAASQVHNQYFSEKRYLGDGSDKWTCTETWTDQRTYSHRPPDVSINCRTGGERSSGLHQLHYVNSSGNPGNILRSTDINTGGGGLGPDVIVCRVDVRNMWRNSSNCQGTGVDVSDKDGMAWSSFRNINSVNEPEYIDYTAADRLEANQTMFKGDTLAAMNGSHIATMQADGNFVLYNASGTPCWSSGTFVANSRLIMQSDGNLVIYTPSNVPVWSIGISNWHNSTLVMGSDGNLFVWDNAANGASWMTGTWSC